LEAEEVNVTDGGSREVAAPIRAIVSVNEIEVGRFQVKSVTIFLTDIPGSLCVSLYELV
jgi:hypothetical protein